MKLFIACFSVVAFLASANAQITLPGACPDVVLKTDLIMRKIMGNFYKQSSYPRVDGNQICLATYSDLKGDNFTFTRTQVKNKTLEKVSIPAKNLGGGRLLLQTAGSNNTFASSLSEVLATDYVSYLITYSCKNVKDGHETFIALGTRSPNPSDEVVKAARDEIVKKGLPVDQLTVTRSKDCHM